MRNLDREAANWAKERSGEGIHEIKVQTEIRVFMFFRHAVCVYTQEDLMRDPDNEVAIWTKEHSGKGKHENNNSCFIHVFCHALCMCMCTGGPDA